MLGGISRASVLFGNECTSTVSLVVGTCSLFAFSWETEGLPCLFAARAAWAEFIWLLPEAWRDFIS
jgi:hypothetical protein